jgi:hypothetical protein
MARATQRHEPDVATEDEPTQRISMLCLREDGVVAMHAADQDVVLQVAAFDMAQFCARYARVSKLAPIFDAVRQVELVEPWFRVEGP